MKPTVSLELDKRAWRPSPLLGQVVLVTTFNDDGTSNVAPKSGVSMMALQPPLLALGCILQHWTAQNVLRRGEFVFNVPGAELSDLAGASRRLPHPRPLEAASPKPIPALQVGPPRIEECKAYLVCRLDRHRAYDDEALLLGRIVAVSVDRDALRAAGPYTCLQPFVFPEDDTYGVMQCARRVRVRHNTVRKT